MYMFLLRYAKFWCPFVANQIWKCLSKIVSSYVGCDINQGWIGSDEGVYLWQIRQSDDFGKIRQYSSQTSENTFST